MSEHFHMSCNDVYDGPDVIVLYMQINSQKIMRTVDYWVWDPAAMQETPYLDNMYENVTSGPS